MAAATVHVEGLRELNRNLAFLNREAAKAVKDALKKAGDPAARKAEQLAVGNISHVGLTWSRMKIGAKTKGIYIAPAARRRGGSARPNLGGLLLRSAMWPAVIQMRPQTLNAVDDALDSLGRRAGF